MKQQNILGKQALKQMENVAL